MTQKEEFIKVLFRAALSIDCEKIAASMKATDWRWATLNEVPDASDVRDSLSELCSWLIDNLDAMHLVEDGQTAAQVYSGGWHYIISYWHPHEYRITIIHGYSGEADNISE